MIVRALAGVALLALLGPATPVPGFAAGGGRDDDSSRSAKPSAEYEEGIALVEAGDYEEARGAFEKAARRRPRDPDVLNMLAYSQRKSGQLDEAIATYKKALRIRPKFPQAREYLGEAYLQAALRELETLKGYGDEAEDERAQLVKALQGALWDLPTAEAGAKKSW